MSLHRFNKGSAATALMIVAVFFLALAVCAVFHWFGVTVDPVKPAVVGFFLWGGAELLDRL
jgi:hypothetical protein